MPPAPPPSDPPLLPTRARIWRVVTAVVAAWMIAWMLVHVGEWVSERTRWLTFQPVNGTFQTFDPARRMIAGQWPARDFDVYLGLGPTYLTRGSMLAFGETYRASVAGTVVVCALLQAVVPAVVARLLGLRPFGALVVGWAAFVFGVAPRSGWLPPAAAEWVASKSYELVSPGNSLLAFRSAAPTFAVLVLALAWRAGRLARPGKWLESALVVGACAGLFLPWSSTYGPATCATTMAAFVLLAPRDALAGRRCAAAMVGCGTALLVASATVTVATGGGMSKWTDFVWNGTARDQGWYFVSGAGQGRPSPLEPAWVVFGIVITVVTWVVAWRTRRLGDAGAVVVLTASALAGSIAASANPLARYFLPLERVAVVAALVLVGRAVTVWWRRSRPATAAWPVACALGVVAVGSPIAVASTTGLARTTDDERRALDRAVLVPEMGGLVPAANHKTVTLAREMRAECEALGLARERRVFSTYSTMIDVVADAFQPTRADYVIHALGTARRSAYVRTLEEVAPPFATTVRADYSDWEGWVRRQNWDVYARLVADYDPWQRTPYAVIWKRRAESRPTLDVPVEVALERYADSEARQLLVTVDARYAPLGTLVVEVELSSRAGFVVDRRSPLPWSGRLHAWVVGETNKGSEFALPPTATVWRFPVEVTPGCPVEVRLVAEGGSFGEVRVEPARACLKRAEIEGFLLSRLMPASIDAGRFRHGVAHAAGAGTGEFVVFDATDLRGIRPGTRLRFAGSGERTVVSVNAGFVQVDGPLDAETDGYPAWITVDPHD